MINLTNEENNGFLMEDIPQEEILELLAKYGPYGEGNPAPVFKSSAKITITREMKGGLHYKTDLSNEKETVTGLFFNVDSATFKERIERCGSRA